MSTKVFDTLSSLRGIVDNLAFQYDRAPLTPSDARTMRDGLMLWGALSLDLLGKRGLNAYVQSLSNLDKIDAHVFGQSIKDAIHAVRHFQEFLEDGEDIHTFPRCVCRRYRNVLFLPIRDTILRYSRSTDEGDFFVILQWVSFLSKLELSDVDRSDEIEAWAQFEMGIREWQYDWALCRELRDIVTEWFSDYVVGDPTITSGAKSELPRRDVTACTAVRHLHAIPEHPEWPAYDDRPCDRIARLEVVPKSMTSGRVVSPEPVTMAYYQKAVSRGMERCMRRHMSRVCDLRDQSRSRMLARQGSIDGSYATIDLSSASDSVTLALVTRIFSGVPALLRDLLGSRSLATRLPDGRIFANAKFAPMGSATCFPVECVVFAACCELCRRRSGIRNRYLIYGDDMVVPAEIVDDVIAMLTQLHFTVNVSKSYTREVRPCFREACGGQYIDGKDVTPLMVSRKLHDHTTMSLASTFVSWASIANRSLDYGYYAMRSYALRIIRLSEPRSRKASRFRTLLSDQPTYQKLRYRSDYQICEEYHFTTRSKWYTVPHSEEERYAAWFVSPDRLCQDVIRPDCDQFWSGQRPRIVLGFAWQ